MSQVQRRSVAEELASVREALNSAMNNLSLAEFLMERVRAAALREGKPADAFDHLGSDLQALAELTREKIGELLRELAMDEAGSRG